MTYTSPTPVRGDQWKADAPDNWASHTPAANTAAVITLAATAGVNRAIDQVLFSYSDIPTGGRLTIVDGGTTLLDIDIDSSDAKELQLPKPIMTAVNSAVVITLAAGGAGISGKLNVRYR